MPGLRIRGDGLIAICVAITTETAIKPEDDTPGTANLKTGKAKNVVNGPSITFADGSQPMAPRARSRA
jgi:hypothetical protein